LRKPPYTPPFWTAPSPFMPSIVSFAHVDAVVNALTPADAVPKMALPRHDTIFQPQIIPKSRIRARTMQRRMDADAPQPDLPVQIPPVAPEEAVLLN